MNELVANLVCTIAAARAGDVDAFAHLVLAFEDTAVALVYGWLGDRDLAHDVAQEAFLEAWRQLPGPREPAARPGLYTQGVGTNSIA